MLIIQVNLKLEIIKFTI